MEIIFVIVFGHVSALCEWAECHFIVIVHAETFPAVFFRAEHHDIVNLADGVEIIPVQFYRFQGIFIAGAIVQIQSAVVVQKQTRVPRRKYVLFDGTFEASRFGMRAVPHGQAFVGGAGIEQRVAAYIGGRRTLVIVRRLALEAGRNEIPIHQVLGIMKTALVGGEQKIFSLVFHSHRVGRGTERTVGAYIVVERLKIIADVHRVAEGTRHRCLRVIPPGCLGRTADCGSLVYLLFHHHLNIGFIQ